MGLGFLKGRLGPNHSPFVTEKYFPLIFAIGFSRVIRSIKKSYMGLF